MAPCVREGCGSEDHRGRERGQWVVGGGRLVVVVVGGCPFVSQVKERAGPVINRSNAAGHIWGIKQHLASKLHPDHRGS